MKYLHDCIFDSDAYEILDGMINPEHERKIREGFEDWLMEMNCLNMLNKKGGANG